MSKAQGLRPLLLGAALLAAAAFPLHSHHGQKDTDSPEVAASPEMARLAQALAGD